MKLNLKLAILVLAIHSLSCIEFPFKRVYKNSVLTFNNNESLILETKGDSVDFFVIADQGGMPDPLFFTPIQAYTADLMSKLGNYENTQFQFALGDNFYWDGVLNEDDPRFEKSFEEPFNYPHLVQTPWFMALGNHDYRGEIEGNATAQVAYTYKTNRWIFPSFLYDIQIKLNAELLIKVLVIDTQLICDEGSEQDREDYFKRVEQKFKSLSKLNSVYFIIAGHYPVWSIGYKGSNQCMINKIRPLLHEYKVDAYFCGDDHTMEHISHNYMGSSVEYIVSGATNFVDDITPNLNTIPANSLKYDLKTGEEQFIGCKNCSGGVVLAKATKNNLNFKYVNTYGIVLYQFDVKPKNQPDLTTTTTTKAYNSANLLAKFNLKVILASLFIMQFVKLQ